MVFPFDKARRMALVKDVPNVPTGNLITQKALALKERKVMLLHRICWREVKPRLHYLYAMTKPGQYRRQELGWVCNPDDDNVWHSFNNRGHLGDYPSLEAAK